MNDKLVAGLVTAVAIAPLCAVCILGPAFLGSLLAGSFGWLAGTSPETTLGLAIIGAILVYAYMRRRNGTARHSARSSSAPGDMPKRTES
jgi:hypothetical protein